MSRNPSTFGSHASLASLALGAAALFVVPSVGCGDDDASASTQADAGTTSQPDSSTSTSPAEEEEEEDASTKADSGNDAGSEQDYACTTTLTAPQNATFVELCALPQGTVQHVSVSGVLTPATHAVAQVLFGFDTPPDVATTSSASATYGADQMRVLFYGGGTPFPPGIIQPTFGAKVMAFSNDASFLRALSTVCFDIHDGSATEGPAIALWVDGQKGASCADKATLTAANTFATRKDWDGTVGALAKNKKTYFWQSADLTALPTIKLSTKRALAAIP